MNYILCFYTFGQFTAKCTQQLRVNRSKHLLWGKFYDISRVYSGDWSERDLFDERNKRLIIQWHMMIVSLTNRIFDHKNH